MEMKRGFTTIILVFLLGISLVSALDLTIKTTTITNTIVNDGDKSAIFDVEIQNNGESGNFEIYTFEKFSVEPNEFNLGKGKTTTLRLSFFPDDPMKDNVGHISTPFYFREEGGSDSQSTEVFIKLVDFDKLFEVKAKDVDPETTSVKISFYNIENLDHKNIKISFSSELFDDKEFDASLEAYEKKDFSVPINPDKLKKLIFGTYPITTTFTIDEKIGTTKGYVNILEKAGLDAIESDKGFIIRQNIIEKTNEGNVPTVAEISIRKNALSRLFTTFSLEPNTVERKGFFIDYYWQQELRPDETLKIKVTTNWIYPLIIIILILVIIWIFSKYYSRDLVIKKSIGFVKTKDDRFALRVNISVKARKFMEKVSIFDRLPAMTNLYEHYGEHPTQFDKNTGRLKWDIGKLSEGEERSFSYIIHSKLKVVGKFELPSATGIYEEQGQIHESKSNRTFFINEPKEIRKAKEF